MEIKKIENCDYVMFPRMQEQGVQPRHIDFDAFRAELRHVEGHGDFWLIHQQSNPHVVCHIQQARDVAHFDHILGWFLGQDKWHCYVDGDLTFVCAFAGCNYDELPAKYPDFIRDRVLAMCDAARWWHEYNQNIMKKN